MHLHVRTCAMSHSIGLIAPIALDEFMQPAIISHLQTLSLDDRYDRFSMVMQDAALASYVRRIDFETDICLGIFDASYDLVGMIHLCVHGRVAELGASVARHCRSQGLGRGLFHSAFKEAISRGIQEIHLATGHPAASHIAQRLGYSIKYGGHYPKAIIILD